MSGIAFVDCETTGLDPGHHSIWELALLVDDRECLWQLAVDLEVASPEALQVGRYYQRRATEDWLLTLAPLVADAVATLTAGRHLAGANPAFDARFLERFLRDNRFAPAWSHRLLDVEAYAAGALGLEVPLGLRETAEKLGIVVAEEGRHTALGDARLARSVYEAARALGGPQAATGGLR